MISDVVENYRKIDGEVEGVWSVKPVLKISANKMIWNINLSINVHRSAMSDIFYLIAFGVG